MRAAGLALSLSCVCAAHAEPLVATLSGVPRNPTEIGVQSVAIELPWEGAGVLTMRFPETLRCNLGLLFIDHVRADMPPVVRVDRLPDWTIDEETGAASYEIELPNDVTFGGTVTPVDGRVDFEFWVRNETNQPLTNLHTQFCLAQTRSRMFSEGSLTRTYLHHDGAWLALADTTHEVMNPERGPWILAGTHDGGPKAHTKLEGCWYVCEERADKGIIATASAEGDKVIALAFEGGQSLMSNGWIPCLHNDPPWPRECPAGETVSVKGRLFILEGGLDALDDVLDDVE